MSLTSVVLKYRSLTPLPKSVISATVFVIPVLGSALLSYYLKLSLERTFQLQVVVGIVGFLVY